MPVHLKGTFSRGYHVLFTSIRPSPRLIWCLSIFFFLTRVFSSSRCFKPCQIVLIDSIVVHFSRKRFSTLLYNFQHFRAARGRSAKCSISDSGLKETFEGESLSFFWSSSEKWGAQVQAPTLWSYRVQYWTTLGESKTVQVPWINFGPVIILSKECWTERLSRE